MTLVVTEERSLTLDRFRGGLLILMVAGDLGAGVDAVPTWLKHAPDIGLTVADLVAPGFVLAIGFTYRASFERRAARGGWKAAAAHLITRGLALIGIGAILSAGSTAVVHTPSQWGVLQALGVATLICLPVVRAGPVIRSAIAFGLLAAYEVLRVLGFIQPASPTDHGGLAGSIPWGAMLILSTVVADAAMVSRRRCLILMAALGLVAAGVVVLIPVSKVRVSASYVLIALAVAAAAYLLTDLAGRLVRSRAGPFAWWGENPLALYLVHLVLLGLVQLLGVAGTSAAPFGVAVVELVLLLVAMTVLAAWLHRRRVLLTL